MHVSRLGKMSVKDLATADKAFLHGIDLIHSRLSIAGPDAILGAAYLDKKAVPIHTIRYNGGLKQSLEFGDPYIPRSVFDGTYPPYLLFLVRWLPSIP